MAIQQITAFLENRHGALLELLNRLAAADINIHALSMAETRDYGALRLIVSDHHVALRALAELGIPVKEVTVLATQIPDRPGALAQVVGLLAERGVDIHYCYAFITRFSDRAWVIFRVAHPAFAGAVLHEQGLPLLNDEDLARLAAAGGATPDGVADPTPARGQQPQGGQP